MFSALLDVFPSLEGFAEERGEPMGPRSRIYGECGDDLFRPWRKTKNLFRASPEEEMVFYISTNRRSAGVAFEYVRINDIKLKTVVLGM